MDYYKALMLQENIFFLLKLLARVPNIAPRNNKYNNPKHTLQRLNERIVKFYVSSCK